MQVEVCTPERVLWRVAAGPEEWLGTTIEFRLEREGDGKTAIYFSHAGWAAETPFHYHCSMKWAAPSPTTFRSKTRKRQPEPGERQSVFNGFGQAFDQFIAQGHGDKAAGAKLPGVVKLGMGDA